MTDPMLRTARDELLKREIMAIRLGVSPNNQRLISAAIKAVLDYRVAIANAREDRIDQAGTSS